jgi:hypothetical protein
MYHYTVENLQAANSSCIPCCCETVAIRPGTIDRLTVNYAPWSVPVGQLHCTPQFALEQMETCPAPIGGNLPPEISASDGMVRFNTGKNVKLVGDLRTKIKDPDGDTMSFKVLPLYAPKHGKLVLDSVGTFEYTPTSNFIGEERFYCSASDGQHSPFVFEVMIAVEIDAGTMVPTPHIVIGTPTVHKEYHTVSIPVGITPAAHPCEVWRLTVLQAAIDCGCDCYTRTDCFDIKVASC